MLRSKVAHDDRKSLEHWLASQDRYMVLEAQKLLSQPWRNLGWPDRLRRLVVVVPFAAFAYALLRGGALDGRAGLHYAFQRLLAEGILSLRLLDHYLRGAGQGR
jgi:hypothetical protein